MILDESMVHSQEMHEPSVGQDKIVRVITKRPSFDLFTELFSAAKTWDLFRTKAERSIGKSTIKHASRQLAQYRDKVVRVTFLI